jgi:hypothetical protein
MMPAEFTTMSRRPKWRLASLHRGAGLRLACDVDGDGKRLAAVRTDSLGECLEALDAPRGEHDLGSLPRQGPRGRLADTRRRTRHQGGTPRKRIAHERR